ncbi:MAG TPA: hypothetical protein VF828_02065 [Patescibacteria group bacterium]
MLRTIFQKLGFGKDEKKKEERKRDLKWAEEQLKEMAKLKGKLIL